MPFSLSRRPGVASRRSVVVAAATGVALAASAASASAATFCVTDSSSTAGCDATFTSATLNPVQQAVDAARRMRVLTPCASPLAPGRATSARAAADRSRHDHDRWCRFGKHHAHRADRRSDGDRRGLSDLGPHDRGVDPGSPALGLGITRGSDLVVRRADDPSNSAYGVYLATGTYDGLSRCTAGAGRIFRHLRRRRLTLEQRDGEHWRG